MGPWFHDYNEIYICLFESNDTGPQTDIYYVQFPPSRFYDRCCFMGEIIFSNTP